MLARKLAVRTLYQLPRFCFTQAKFPEIKGTYYEILGVKQDAEKEDIRKAYKELGKSHLD